MLDIVKRAMTGVGASRKGNRPRGVAFLAGPTGVGKTELARAVAQATGSGLVRLQCYEGVDEARALYEWNHAKQILRIQAGSGDWEATKTDVFSEEFLLQRPLLTAI
ncbi:AAA family ATPase, partial [Klebsiella pneumoniae]|uniref:AAA family ATPase n=1 Tax=Klebsiella pneumoniae TaxID=573 RepID=UPI001C71DF59